MSIPQKISFVTEDNIQALKENFYIWIKSAGTIMWFPQAMSIE